MNFNLVSTAKNEGPYIWEWVAHHMLVGFDNIIIFQNDSDDKTHEILTALDQAGVITYRYNRAKRGFHQINAYRRSARQGAYQASDWAMALDLDEFLVVKTGGGKRRVACRGNTGSRLYFRQLENFWQQWRKRYSSRFGH